MSWIILLVAAAGVAGIAAFLRTYQRRLDALTGPWIARELAQDE